MATLYLGDTNAGAWLSRLGWGGESHRRQEVIVTSSAGVGPESDCAGKVQ
jgi:hypothetical protein